MKEAGGSVPKTVDDYLSQVPEPARSTLEKIRATIRSTVPAEATEAVSYGVPTFQYKGPLIGFGAFPDHCSLFPMSSSLTTAFQSELQNFHLQRNHPLPFGQTAFCLSAKEAGEGADC